MLVKELVGGEVLSIAPEVSIAEAARAMHANDVGALAVVDEYSELEGIITERDLVKAMAAGDDPEATPTRNWMTEYPDTFGPEMDVSEAADWMLATGYRHIPIIDQGTPIGMMSIKDVLWALTGANGG